MASTVGRGLAWTSAAVLQAEEFSPPPRDQSSSGCSIPACLVVRHVLANLLSVEFWLEDLVGKVPFFQVSWKQIGGVQLPNQAALMLSKEKCET